MACTLSTERKREFATIFLLEKMINDPMYISILLEGNDAYLEALLSEMLAKDYVDIKDVKEAKKYVPTEKGRELVVGFMRRYQDFLKNLDVFCAIDLEEGEFAFESYWEIEDEGVWNSYLEEDRWEDLRVAAALYKGIDPIELIFMSFINEDRFGQNPESGWQFDLELGSLWDEMVNICESALTMNQLGYEDDDGRHISGEDVLRDILRQGAALNRELWEEEDEMNAEEEQEEDDDQPRFVDRVEPEDIDEEIFNRYSDPRYVNPVWRN